MSRRTFRRPLAAVELREPLPRYWTRGRFSITTTIAPESRGMVTYPLSITLMHRLGDDGTYLCQDLSFADAEEIHRWLGRILRDRTAYAKAVKAAKGRRQGA